MITLPNPRAQIEVIGGIQVHGEDNGTGYPCVDARDPNYPMPMDAQYRADPSDNFYILTWPSGYNSAQATKVVADFAGRPGAEYTDFYIHGKKLSAANFLIQASLPQTVGMRVETGNASLSWRMRNPEIDEDDSRSVFLAFVGDAFGQDLLKRMVDETISDEYRHKAATQVDALHAIYKKYAELVR